MSKPPNCLVSPDTARPFGQYGVSDVLGAEDYNLFYWFVTIFPFLETLRRASEGTQRTCLSSGV